MPNSITFGDGATKTTFDHNLCCGYRLALVFKAGGGGGGLISNVKAAVQIAFSSPSKLPESKDTLGRGQDISVFSGVSPFRANSDCFAFTLGKCTINLASIDHNSMQFMQRIVGKEALTVFTFECPQFDHQTFANDGSTLNTGCSTDSNLNNDRGAASGLVSWQHSLPAAPADGEDPLAADRNRVEQAPYEKFADGSDKICWTLVQSRGSVVWDTGRTNQNSVVDFLLKQMGMGSSYGFILTYKLNNAAGAMEASDTIDSTQNTTSLNYILYEEVSGVFEKVHQNHRFHVTGGPNEQPPSEYLELNRSALESLPVCEWNTSTGVKERVYLVTTDPHWNWPRFR